MKTFSERKGLKPVSEVIQVASMNEERWGQWESEALGSRDSVRRQSR
jgi:hypothetical protein